MFALPLTEIYAPPDWRFRLAGDEQILAIEDQRGRLIAYCAIAGEPKFLKISEAAAGTKEAALSSADTFFSFSF